MPAHSASGTVQYSDSAGITVVWPSTVADRQAFLWVQTKNVRVDTPSGWTEQLWINNGKTAGTSAALGLQIFSKVSLTTNPDVSIASTGSFLGGFISVFTGVDTAAPINNGFVTDSGVFGEPTGTYGSGSNPVNARVEFPVTWTDYNDGFFVFLAINTTDTASAAFSALTARHPYNSYTSEIRDSQSSTGTGGGFALNVLETYYAGGSGKAWLTFNTTAHSDYLAVVFSLKSSTAGTAITAGYSQGRALGQYETQATAAGTATGTSTVTSTESLAAALSTGSCTGTATAASINVPVYAGASESTSTVTGAGIAAYIGQGASTGIGTAAAAHQLLVVAGTAAGTSTSTAAHGLLVGIGISISGSSVLGYNAFQTADGLAAGAGTATAIRGFIGPWFATARGTSTAVTTWAYFAPSLIAPGYSFSTDTLTFPISALPGLSAAEANATTGDWRELFQALCLLNHDWLAAIPASQAPQTVASFMLENWRHHSSTFGYTMKRKITADFIVENVPPNIFE